MQILILTQLHVKKNKKKKESKPWPLTFVTAAPMSKALSSSSHACLLLLLAARPYLKVQHLFLLFYFAVDDVNQLSGAQGLVEVNNTNKEKKRKKRLKRRGRSRE